jgi:hypothetical protein
MPANREKVFKRLLDLQTSYGGYYGTDLADIAHEHNISTASMQVNLCRWRADDKRFALLIYLGRRRPNYSLREFIPALDQLAKNIIAKPILFLDELNYKRKVEGLPPIPKSSFFKVLAAVGFTEAARPYVCRLGYYKNCVFLMDKLDANRKALFDLFTFKGIQRPFQLSDILKRYESSTDWFIKSYPGINPYSFFEYVHPKDAFLRAFFFLLNKGKTPDLEARLIFELEVLFIVDCAEILCEYFLSEDQNVKCDNFSDDPGDVTDNEMYSFFADLLNRIKEGRKRQR